MELKTFVNVAVYSLPKVCALLTAKTSVKTRRILAASNVIGSKASDLTGVSRRGLSKETSQAPLCQPAGPCMHGGQQTPWNGSKACRTCYLLVSRTSETKQRSTCAHSLLAAPHASSRGPAFSASSDLCELMVDFE